MSTPIKKMDMVREKNTGKMATYHSRWSTRDVKVVGLSHLTQWTHCVLAGSLDFSISVAIETSTAFSIEHVISC